MLTTEQQFLAERTGLKMPCLPFKTAEEDVLYNKLLRQSNGKINAEEFAIKWVGYCNRMKIFPKLPFYISRKHKKWVRNNATRKQLDGTEFSRGQAPAPSWWCQRAPEGVADKSEEGFGDQAGPFTGRT